MAEEVGRGQKEELGRRLERRLGLFELCGASLCVGGSECDVVCRAAS